MRWVYGPAVTFRADHAIQIDFEIFGDADLRFAKTHPDAKLALLGLPCTEAAKHLAFTDQLDPSVTCTHHDASGWVVGVNLVCHATVEGLAIVWSPPGVVRDHQLPADQCDLAR